MTYMSEQKCKKTLYLPKWIVTRLDSEGDILDGPGVIAGTAILAFLESKPETKAIMLKRYREREISEAYGLTEESTTEDKMGKAVKKAKAKTKAAQGRRIGRMNRFQDR